jgi:hypothetical protein
MQLRENASVLFLETWCVEIYRRSYLKEKDTFNLSGPIGGETMSVGANTSLYVSAEDIHA